MHMYMYVINSVQIRTLVLLHISQIQPSCVQGDNPPDLISWYSWEKTVTFWDTKAHLTFLQVAITSCAFLCKLLRNHSWTYTSKKKKIMCIVVLWSMQRFRAADDCYLFLLLVQTRSVFYEWSHGEYFKPGINSLVHCSAPAVAATLEAQQQFSLQSSATTYSQHG